MLYPFLGRDWKLWPRGVWGLLKFSERLCLQIIPNGVFRKVILKTDSRPVGTANCGWLSFGADRDFYSSQAYLQLKVCQSPVVPDTSLPYQSEKRSSKSGTNNTYVENSTVVLTSTGTPEGLPLDNSSTIRLDISATGTRIYDATESIRISGNPMYHEDYFALFRHHAHIMEG